MQPPSQTQATMGQRLFGVPEQRAGLSSPTQPGGDGGARPFSAPPRPPDPGAWLRGAALTALANKYGA